MRLLAAALLAALAAGCSPGREESWTIEGCTRTTPPGHSVARVWDEAILAAIRRDVPAPTVHARNLFHLSAAMWDAWAAYDARADGYFVQEKHRASDVRAAREAAMSYAAYRLLLHRYSLAAGLEATFADLTATMRALCYRIDHVTTEGGSPAALGNRIAAAAIAFGKADGSLEGRRYADPEYRPANPPLVVRDGTIDLPDPDRWQPLALDEQIAQNGVRIPSRVQSFIGSHWGRVKAFALPAAPDGLPIDPGPPPAYGTRAYVDAALEVLRRGSRLEPRERALAEYWADGPDSETPPGHWNAIANDVSDALTPPARLAWDARLYFALNGALHDAAVAAWGAKRHYDYVRPISMVRYLAARDELPLVPGLVRRGADGTIEVHGWLGPGKGVGWLPAAAWTPYQRPTFVTPAFAAYVSGHSTFSRAGAEVLAALTGSPAFPAGMLELRVRPADGPSRPVSLRWRTYFEAADAAGMSRLYGGIHVLADHTGGARVGALCGKNAWALAQRYFDGTARA